MTIFPKNVKLFSTTRSIHSGAGKACSGKSGYADFNLATHVGDDIKAVMRNRDRLIEQLSLPSVPKYLEQIHSNICLQASDDACVGDALVTKDKRVVCAILTADCLPIFACNPAGTQVGVAHAGWKGIVNGVIESLVEAFDGQKILIHFGPAISQQNFAVGAEVYQQFVDKDLKLEQAFIKHQDKYLLDMYQAARIVLRGLGVQSMSGGDECTFAQKERYFSYRRDGAQSGRMAHLIWIQ